MKLNIKTIVPDQAAEISYTRFGPIFNLRMAFSADRKDSIIDSFDSFEVLLRHEDGDSHTLKRVGMNESLSEIADITGNRQFISKDQPAIALKIGTESLIEKFVRFQEPRFNEVIKRRSMSWLPLFII